MNNYKLIFIFVGIIVLLFSSCAKETNKVTLNENGFFAPSYGNEITEDNSNKTETTTENTVFYHPEVELVILDYVDTKREYKETQIPFDFIDEIKKCKTVPDTNVRMSIGEMKLKYKDSDKEESFAKLYLGSDGGIYAKYNKSKNPDYAYKINF